MKKKILILLIPFLLTGCASVNYELDIDKNINVSEKVKITATSDFFNILLISSSDKNHVARN